MDGSGVHAAHYQHREAYNTDQSFHGRKHQVIAVSFDDGTSIDPRRTVLER